MSFYSILMKIMSANSVDPDQTPHDVASYLGLHCLPATLFSGFQVRAGSLLLRTENATKFLLKMCLLYFFFTDFKLQAN